MRGVSRLLLAVVVLGLWYTGQFWPGMIVAAILAARHTPYELVLIGFLIDVQFTSLTTWPWYTSVGIVCLGGALWLKPRLIAYTRL